MTGLIDLAPAFTESDVNTGEITEWVTGFSLRLGDGPTVTAALVGDLWQLSFHGKSNDDACRLAVDEHEARLAAIMLARRLAELEPGRQSYEAQRRALSAWLKSLGGRKSLAEPADGGEAL